MKSFSELAEAAEMVQEKADNIRSRQAAVLSEIHGYRTAANVMVGELDDAIAAGESGDLMAARQIVMRVRTALAGVAL